MPALHEQARPRQWADVAGQSEAVASIRTTLARGWGGRAWWITGASGTGKTTCAKIIATEGASDLATREIEACSLTPAGLRAIERGYGFKPLPIDGKRGWCLIVNECHKLRKNTVTALLDVLERLPDYVAWVFTTTRQGQKAFFADDEAGDKAPLVSRCVEVELANDAPARSGMAARAKAVAMAAGCDGLPIAAYEQCLYGCRGNMRALLQRVESGQLRREARQHVAAELAEAVRMGAKRRIPALEQQLAELA